MRNITIEKVKRNLKINHNLVRTMKSNSETILDIEDAEIWTSL